MSFRAVPIEGSRGAAITAADRVLIWLRAQNVEAANELFSSVAKAFAEGAGNKDDQISVCEDLTRVVLSMLVIAHAEGSISGVKSSETDEVTEITKSYDEFCAEMEEALMAFICAFENDVNALKRLVKLVAEETDCPDVKLRILMYTFNSQEMTSPLKASLFTTIVEFAASSRLLELAVVPVLKRAGDWPEGWPITPAQRKELYAGVASKLKSIEQMQMALEWSKRAVKALDDGDAADAEAVSLAAECLRDTIASPTEFYFDQVLKMKAVANLAKNKTHSPLHQLAVVLLSGTVQQMSRLFEAHPKLCSTYNLKEVDLMKKIRVIAVASEALKSQKDDTLFSRRTLKLADLAKVVGLSEEETEDACVSGVGHGLFIAKIDQLNKTIDIDSAMCRKFELEDWRMLKTRLQQWQIGVNEMCNLLSVQSA